MQNTNFFLRSFVCIAVMAVLSVLAVNAWGRCTPGYWNGICNRADGGYFTNFSPTYCGTISVSGCGYSCSSTYNSCGDYSSSKFVLATFQFGSCIGSGTAVARFTFSQHYVMCDNECEADSVKNGGFVLECQYDVDTQMYYRWHCPGDLNCSSCSRQYYTNQTLCQEANCQDNPSLPECAPVDSVVVCENATQVEDGPIYTQMLLFKCVKSDNSSGFDSERCRLMMNVPGTCGQNGYQSGVQPSDSVAPDVDCFAAFENTCYMQDKKSLNTFACSCDNNSCYLAKLAVASGDCKNPYASSSPSSSGSSSPSSSPSSSATSGGSSSPSSSGGERPPESVDSPKTDSAGIWNYNYSGILNAINNNVIWVGNGVQSLNSSVQSLGGSMERLNENSGATRANTQLVASNTQYTNTLLNQKVIPAIQSASSAITGKLDQVHGEWAGMWSDFVSSASTDFEYQDTLDYTLQPDYDEEVSDTGLTNFRDSVMSQKRSLDSVIAYVDSVRNDTTTNYVALDSIYNWSDTAQIKTKLNKFFIPNVSPLQSCPAFEFTETWPVIGEQRTFINFGNVLNGVDLCELIRGFVRFATLIFILFNSVRAIIRAFSSGGT